MTPRILTLFLALTALSTGAAGASSPFTGTWAFELPGGGPAWLEIAGDGSGQMLWSVGNPRPINDLVVEDGKLRFKWKRKWRPAGDPDHTWILSGRFEGAIGEDGSLRLETSHERQPDGLVEALELSGKKMPPMPPRPDLSKAQFGEPITLFNGEDLSGWNLSDPKKKNGWRAEDGVLVNETPKTDFSAYGEFGNLVTEALFGDFRLSLEYNAPAGGNSGVYLRGMYEAQVVDRDSKMQGQSGPGAIFGRILPSENAGKPGGEWNRYVLTLADRHITVELNGKTVIDNQPLVGCTGGGISADDTAPGPIFLQGDHTSVRYRDITLQPLVQTDTIPLEFRGLWHLPSDMDDDGEADIDLYLLLSETEVVTLGPDGKTYDPDTTGWVDGDRRLWTRTEEEPYDSGRLDRQGDRLSLDWGDGGNSYTLDQGPLSKAEAIALLSERYTAAPEKYRNQIETRRSVVLPPSN